MWLDGCIKGSNCFSRFFTVLVRPWTGIYFLKNDWCKVSSIFIPSSRHKADTYTSSSSTICKVFSPMDSTSTAAVWMRWWADVSPAENVASAASSSGESVSHERQPCFNAGCTARRRDFHPHRQLLPIALMKLPTVRHWVTYDRGAGTPDGKLSLMDSYKRRPYLYNRNSGVMFPSFRVMIFFPPFLNTQGSSRISLISSRRWLVLVHTRRRGSHPPPKVIKRHIRNV